MANKDWQTAHIAPHSEALASQERMAYVGIFGPQNEAFKNEFLHCRLADEKFEMDGERNVEKILLSSTGNKITGIWTRIKLCFQHFVSVLRIRDPVLFYPPDPGSGMEQWSDPDPG
jgi:hypothetical protein